MGELSRDPTPMRNKTGWQPDDTYVPCPKCNYVPPRHEGPGIPVRMGGTIHKSDCPTIPRPSPEAERALRERLREMDRCRARAWASAHNYVIGGG